MFRNQKLTFLITTFLLFSAYLCNSNAFWQETTSNSKNTISFAAVGDIMMGTTWPEGLPLPPNDGADLLKEVTPILSKTDIAFGNLEGPMLEGGKSSKCGSNSKNCYAFRVPTRYGKYLKEAGFDLLSLANNHANDFGAFGMESSQKVLDALGIVHSGPIGSIGNLIVKDKKVSLVAFATNAVSYNLNDIETAKKVVAETAKKSDIVIVSFHGGAEGEEHQNVPNGREIYLGEERGDLRKFSHAVIDAGADLVLGHGPHVVRGMEVYKERLIAYSLGNFATYGAFNLTGAKGLSLILEGTINSDGKFLSGKIHPLKQEKPGGPQIDPEKKVISVTKSLSQQDFNNTSVKINEDGIISFP